MPATLPSLLKLAVVTTVLLLSACVPLPVAPLGPPIPAPGPAQLAPAVRGPAPVLLTPAVPPGVAVPAPSFN